MKKIKWILTFCLFLTMSACSFRKEPYQQIELSSAQLQTKIENKEDFCFMVIRQECNFCESLYTYIEETKEENAGTILYTIDITDYDFSKEEEGSKKLKSESVEGQYLLSLCPYFLYTPSIYRVEKGVITESAIGFSERDKTVSLWDLDSFIDFNEAETMNFWEFIK